MSTIHPLSDARRALQEGSITARELLERHLSIVDKIEPDVRAMVTVTVDMARQQADEADRRLRAGESAPLLGIPVVVKDLIDVEGIPTTAGSKVLAGNIAGSSAPSWVALKDAGAVLLGKANTHEFAYGGTTEPTRNPWDLSRMVGGSSGGPAAALAAGFCLGALGSDTAGSIRIPANLCGVAGLKPTRGIVSTEGVIPLSPTLDVVGPMARHAADLISLFTALVPGSADEVVTSIDLGQFKVGLLSMEGPSDPSAREAVDRAIQTLRRAGASVVPARLDGLPTSLGANFTIMGYEAAQYHRQFEDRRDLYTPYVRDRLAEAAAVTTAQYEDARSFAEDLTARVDDLLAEVDVILMRGVAFPAPPAYDPNVLIEGEWRDRDTELCRNTAFANLTGHPVVAVPIMEDAGLPMGVQLVGKKGNDALLIAVAGELQDRIPA